MRDDDHALDWAGCSEVVCCSCGAIFDLWCGDESRRSWRLWGLRYGDACPACGSSHTDGWCIPHGAGPLWQLGGLVPRGFVVGVAGTMTIGALAFAFLSWWGLAFIAIGIAALALRVIVSKRQLDVARRAGKASDNTAAAGIGQGAEWESR